MSNRNHNAQTREPHPSQPDSTLNQRVDTMIDNAKSMGGHPAEKPAPDYSPPTAAVADATAVRKPKR